jgi:hypothetical protein
MVPKLDCTSISDCCKRERVSLPFLTPGDRLAATLAVCAIAYTRLHLLTAAYSSHTGRPPLRASPGAAGQLRHHAGPQHDHALQQQGPGDPPGTYDTYVNTLFTIDAEGFCVGAMCRKYCVLRWPDCVGGYDAVIIPTPPRKPFVVFIVLSLRLTLFFICTQLSRRVPRR